MAAKQKARLRGNDVPMQPSGDMQAMRRPVVPLALAVGTYVVIALLAYWPVMPFDASKLPHVLGAGSGDPAQMSWFLAWTPFALGHGLNPFFTNYIDYPLGVNLASNTSVPLLGFLAAPVTLALGPIASFNLLMRIALAGSATSMFLVSRRWVRWWPAAFAAGLLYGFGSYMTFEASVHLDLAFMAVPPLLLWCLDELFVTRRRSSINVGVLLGVLSAAQLLIDPEILAYCAIMAALGLVFLAIAHRREVVARVRMATPGLLAACACFALIAGYPIGYFLTGPRRIAGGIQPAGAIAAFHVDLLRPVLRASPQLVNSSGYLGVPLLIGLVALAVWWRKVGVFRFSVACACAAFVLSLGPRLTVDGHTFPVWLPEAVFEHVPVLVDLEPVRITGIEMLFLAVVLAVGLDHTRTWILEHPRTAPGFSGHPVESRVRRLASRMRSDSGLGTLALLVLLVVVFVPLLDQLPLVKEQDVAAPQLTSSLARSVPSGGVVLAFPYPRAHNDEPMEWQAADEMSFRLVGGYALVPGLAGRGSYYIAQGPDLNRLSLLLVGSRGASGVSLESVCRSLEAVVREYHVDALVLRTSEGAIRTGAIASLTRLLGSPSVSFEAGVAWYDVPGRKPTRSCPASS